MEGFGTAGIRGSARERVTPDLALAVGQAAGRDGDEFVVGRDGRTTGPALAAAVEAGLESAGADVRRVGQVPTPALAFASRDRHGVMVTASHNPSADNGLKLFADGREYDRRAERRVEECVAGASSPVEWDEWGASETADPLPAYRGAVADYAREHGAPLDGLRVAVDCGNGMAALATPQVLRALGGEVVALNANVDGHFPGRGSKPTPESLADLRAFVADGEFAFGIGHDGDADRIVVVDGDGEVVHEDTVLTVLAAHYVRESDAGDPVVVTTPNASARIDEQVEAAGGRTERAESDALHEGITTALESGETGTEVAFAAEPWKHTHTGFGPWIDGVASAAVLARLVTESGLDGLREPVHERPYRKGNVDCPEGRKEPAMGRLTEALPDAFPDADVSTEHGVRLSWGGEWVLVRPSGTEPYLRIYAEHESVDEVVSQVVEVVEDAVEATG